MNNSQSQNYIKNWSIQDSIKTYGIDKWGDKYFSINSEGNIAIKTNQGEIIDLLKLVKEIKSRKINPPLIIRFNDILKDRIHELNNSFNHSINKYKYQNIYQGVFPVKCNHQKNIIEKIIEFGSPWNLGLEVGSTNF